MNGMLQPNDFYRDGVQRRQQEARDWARANAMGRLAHASRKQTERPARRRHRHSMHTHLRALRMHLRAIVLPSVMRHHHRTP